MKRSDRRRSGEVQAEQRPAAHAAQGGRSASAGPRIPPGTLPALQAQRLSIERLQDGPREARQGQRLGALAASASSAPVQRSLLGAKEGPTVEELLKKCVDMRILTSNPASARYQCFLRAIASDTKYGEDDILNQLLDTEEEQPGVGASGSAPAIDKDHEANDSGSDPDLSGMEDDDDCGNDYQSDDDYDYDDYDYGDELDFLEEPRPQPVRPQPQPLAASTSAQGDARQEADDKPFQAGDASATIIWTGGNLGTAFISYFKKTLMGMEDAAAEPSDRLAKHLLDRTLHNETDEGNLKHLAMVKADDIQQQLDQEMEFATNVSMVQQRLAAWGVSTRVFRPADAHLLKPGAPYIPADWTPLEDPSVAAIDPGSSAKQILVTMGHGTTDGSTSFAAGGWLKQADISQKLRIPAKLGGKAVLYVPLQCHPTQAVKKGTEQGWQAGSVNADGRIDSRQVQEWIDEGLPLLINDWMAQPEDAKAPPYFSQPESAPDR